MTDLLQNLNTEQAEAVVHGDGQLLIFAGAGSGKTRTLTRRIAHLIQNRDVPPARILSVTFTNRAAGEMRERLAELVGEGARQIWTGTFHSICARMLRISGGSIGLDPRFVIFDSDDQMRLMKDIIKNADLDGDKFPPSRVLHKISDQKNKLLTPDQFDAVAHTPNDRLAAKLYHTYQQRLRASNALDFDDLLFECVRLLEQSAAARSYWSDRFLHVLIDEFQDVNVAQFRWAQLLASKHRNICVVGDDDQSIYAWRGANVKIILDFEISYPKATVIRLEQNYRSTQPILDAAHGVISNNLGRKPKKLWTVTNGGAQVKLHGAISAQEEAAWVVRQIQSLYRERDRGGKGRGGKWEDFALLCRVNAQSRPFEEAFLRARVPLRLVGTQRFYERREIKDLIAYLKLLFNPRDDIAATRIINVPARGIGAVTLQKLQTLARQSDRSVFQIITEGPLKEELGKTVAAKIQPMRDLLIQLQQDAVECTTLADMISAVIDRIDYLEWLRREKTLDSVDRIANVQELLRAAEDFDKQCADGVFDQDDDYEDYNVEQDTAVFSGSLFSQPEPANRPSNLSLFLESSALEGGTDGGESGDAVTLMTLHSAKGLEFPVVFLVGMEQGLLPHARALWGEGSNNDELEEERRLCYVGLTRAREQVILTYAAQRTLHGRTESSTPSQFLDEIPETLLEREGLAKQGASAFSLSTSWDSPSSSSSSSSSSSVKEVPSFLRPKVPTEKPTYKIGDQLKHPTFGEGYVVNTSPGGGAGEWVEIAFTASGAGKKKLVVGFATLERV